MSDTIDSLAQLEAVIGKAPPAIHLKVIDHLDESALRWIAASPIAFLAFGEGAGIAITLGGGAPGFAHGTASTLRLPLAMLDDASLARPGAAFGSLFLAPGLGETLRVNGTVAETLDGEALITVQECYVHCAKALIRSDFWPAAPIGVAPSDAAGFIDASRFMALATIDAQGHADLSPKGDPAGSMARMNASPTNDNALWFADRPGNRRVDSFRNLVSQPRMAAALLIPGSTSVASVRGHAMLTTDAAQRERFAVRGKAPLLAIRVGDLQVDVHPSPALARARLWPLTERAENLDPAKMFVAHVKLNKEKSVMARVGSVVMSIPGLMQRGLDSDYRNNLY